MPTLLDTKPRLPGLPSRAPGGDEEYVLLPKAREHLDLAVEYLKRATDADPLYIPARLNLAVAYFYLNDIYKARAVIEEARKLAPDRSDVNTLRALILYRDGLSTDMWPQAVEMLESLTAHSKADVCTLFNFAQIMEERGRRGQAQEMWSRLAPRLAELAPRQQDVVCNHTKEFPQCQAKTKGSAVTTLPATWTIPVGVGLKLDDSAHRGEQVFEGWHTLSFNAQQKGFQGNIYQAPDGTVALDLEGTVEMVVLRGDSLGRKDVLQHCCPVPSTKRIVTNGELWTYGNTWAALIQDEVIREVWVRQH